MVAKVKKKPAKPKAEPKKTGRPTKYTEALGNTIAMRMANGESVKAIGRDAAMPDAATIFRWALDSDHPFYDQYTRARMVRAETLIDELVEIADDGTNDFVEEKRKDGSTLIVADHEHIQRSRLRLDTRKWFASKVVPKLYGDKLQHTGEGGEGPVNITINQSGKGARAD
jgi:hypothetical protein